MDNNTFDNAKAIFQKIADVDKISVSDFIALDNFLGEVRRNLINKPVETTNEQPRNYLITVNKFWCRGNDAQGYPPKASIHTLTLGELKEFCEKNAVIDIKLIG